MISDRPGKCRSKGFIYTTVEAAHKFNKWVGLCGELGGEVAAAALLVGRGLYEITMSPISIFV